MPRQEYRLLPVPVVVELPEGVGALAVGVAAFEPLLDKRWLLGGGCADLATLGFVDDRIGKGPKPPASLRSVSFD